MHALFQHFATNVFSVETLCKCKELLVVGQELLIFISDSFKLLNLNSRMYLCIWVQKPLNIYKLFSWKNNNSKI